MMNRLKFLLLSTIFFELTQGQGQICRYCLQVTSLTRCLASVRCLNNNGCFSYSPVINGIRIYSKGCQQAGNTTQCEDLNSALCTLSTALVCCKGDSCNANDPVEVWKPQSPRLVQILHVESGRLILAWQLQCNGLYIYQVEYARDGETPTIKTTNTSQITLLNLPGGNYQFKVRSMYNGRSSPTTIVERTVPGPESSPFIFCTLNNNDDVSRLPTPSSFVSCTPDEQHCSTSLSYPSNSSPALLTRGCSTREACHRSSKDNYARCRPGVAGSFCGFCCQTINCNSNFQTASKNFTCIGIPQTKRIECGWVGISNATCLARDCCYDDSGSKSYDKWCFHKRFLPVLSDTTTVSPGPALGYIPYWVVICIIVVLIILLVIIILIVLAVRKRRRKKKGSYNVSSIYAVPTSRTTNFT